MSDTLLIEIGLEELPPKAMRRLADAFAQGLARELTAAGLDHGEVKRYATPRRIAAAIADTPGTTPPSDVEKTGPTTAIAFDATGAPTAAAEGFAQSVGTTVDALEREDGPKGERLVYRATEPGRPLDALLQAMVDRVLRSLPIPKRMRWGDNDHAFVRPVHWVVALHGSGVVPLTVFGHAGGRATHGHRFHHPGTITLDHADAYAVRLHDPGHVIADPDMRRERIIDEVGSAGRRLGGRALIDAELAEEVTALVEWPTGLAGRFDARYLVLPREALVATLEGHQRYFPVADEHGALMPGFVTVANLDSADVRQVVAGNERVVRPRLADALFFWEQDRRHGLAAHVDGLSRVSFQQALGSLADKSARIAALAGQVNAAIGAPPADVARAAQLAKTDLLTEMVDEFPELQGVMGRYYARDAGESPSVADALAEQYDPVGAGAPIATSATGRVLALADRLDTLAGIFAIDRRPSGDKDPFALRRAALGVLRTLIEGGIRLDLRAILAAAIAGQPVTPAPDTESVLWMFHMERLRGYYAEQGVAGERFDAVAALGLVDMTDIDARIRALDAFMLLPAARTLCGAHKRIRNILRRNADAVGDTAFDPDRAETGPERALADAFAARRDTVHAAVAGRAYNEALAGLAELAAPLDAFFDDVMVMADDDVLRRNRLALLGALDALCREVADISRLSLD